MQLQIRHSCLFLGRITKHFKNKQKEALKIKKMTGLFYFLSKVFPSGNWKDLALVFVSLNGASFHFVDCTPINHL